MEKTNTRYKIFVINGSASERSANQKLIEKFAELTKEYFDLVIFNSLKALPHFDPELSIDHTPNEILLFRNSIEKSDAVLICTPEYVFSIPSGLKNAIEWCVSTTVFSNKPVGLITASASGRKGHEELQLIMKTIMAEFSEQTTLLIPGVKGKLNEQGEITDSKTKEDFSAFALAFKLLVEKMLV
jgi:chromate reductase